MTTSLAIVLAAGQGTRMRSRLPKVMHEVGKKPMFAHVLQTAHDAGVGKSAIVIGPDADALHKLLQAAFCDTLVYVQRERLGTGHAVLAAKDAISNDVGKVIVLYGDVPLIRAETVRAMLGKLDELDLVVLGFEADEPHGYGRLVTGAGGALLAIREEKDANEGEKAIRLCNSGLMAFHASGAVQALEGLKNTNAQGEYYLTDLVETYVSAGRKVGFLKGAADEVAGVNNRAQLSEAEGIFQNRKRLQTMLDGVTMTAPETVFFSADTHIEPDVTIEPNVVFGAGVTVKSGARIRAFSYLEGAHVGEGAEVGPYARLREGTELGEKAKVGNFVETKKARVEAGAKINHLSYIGDAFVGAGANIGAGTITCNYDGFLKYQTTIGAGAFVGSNSALVAPVRIGEGAYIGSGSVITHDVAPDALAVARGRQVEKPDWAKGFRAEKKRLKEEKR